MNTNDFFISIAPNTPEKVQAWAAAITALVAFFALFTWRLQKSYDLYLEALSMRQTHYSAILHASLQHKLILPKDGNFEEYLIKSSKIEYDNNIELLENKFDTTYDILKHIPKYRKRTKRLYRLYKIYQFEYWRLSYGWFELHRNISTSIKSGEGSSKDLLDKMIEDFQVTCNEVEINITMETSKFILKTNRQSNIDQKIKTIDKAIFR